MSTHSTASHRAAILVSVASTAIAARAASAHPISAPKAETPPVYVQVGIEVNPSGGDHPFMPLAFAVGPDCVPDTCWLSPATMSLVGSTVSLTGSSTHLIALHGGEDAPAPTWSYSISRSFPTTGPFAVETRIRRNIRHPGPDNHTDSYVAVVGALFGTVPGPSLEPRFVIIGGTLGVHTDNPPPEQGGTEPIHGGASLKTPSGQPSPDNWDSPAGQLITNVQLDSMQVSMMLFVEGMNGNLISNVYVHEGQNGPIVCDLRPHMNLRPMDPYSSSLIMDNEFLPPNAVELIATGEAWISVRFPRTVHPDGEVAGQVVPVQCKAGDIDCDGVTGVPDLLRVLNDWGLCQPAPQECPADIAPPGGDGNVGVPELLMVISNWGP